jgi:3-hydroxy-9,10-secoandrosta-1,3,5(10)-triene-9,17-dione monooxygenase reductase component
VQIEEFKAAVGKFPTGVAVVSTKFQDQLCGFTSNTFTSVSLEPSLVSFCLDKKAGSIGAFLRSDHFGISILSADQVDISKHFASKIIDKFDGINYKIASATGVPLINEAVCTIECIKYQQIECGDHYIFIGEVKKTSIDNTKAPLIYFAKSYSNTSYLK